jgi:hypothetical protein
LAIYSQPKKGWMGPECVCVCVVLFSFFFLPSISWFPKFDEISKKFSQNFPNLHPKKIPQILENSSVATARKFARFFVLKHLNKF